MLRSLTQLAAVCALASQYTGRSQTVATLVHGDLVVGPAHVYESPCVQSKACEIPVPVDLLNEDSALIAVKKMCNRR